MSINPLSIEDLMSRKDEVVEAHNEAMNDLEQKYFSDVTQLYRIKQAMQCQLQTSLMDSLHEINTMIKQKMGTHTHYNNTSASSNSVISLASPPMISTTNINGHHSHKNKSRHYSSGRPKPPSFSSHRQHHRHGHNVLPISSLPVIQAPAVPLSTSIDAILHHKQHQVASPLLNKRKKKKRRKNNTNGGGLPLYQGAAGDNAPDPLSLDFNLVTVPDEILNDVKTIVANNNARHKNKRKKKQNLPKKPRAPLMYNSNNREESHSIEAPHPAINNRIKQDTKADLKPDVKGDLKPDTLECSLCHQAFDTQQNLNAHLDSAHSFKCDLCSKSFQKRIDLKRHQRLHEGVKVYECKICYKTYRSPGSLHNHMRLHEVSNLFTCSYCKKGFTQSHHLKRHLRIHTGVTPFRCRYCERPFKYNTSCRRHERTVHRDVYRPETPGDTINNPNAAEDALRISNNENSNNNVDAGNEGDDDDDDDEETEHEV